MYRVYNWRLTEGLNVIASADNAIVSGNNSIVSTDNAIVSGNNSIVSTDNAIVSRNNLIASPDNAIVSGNNLIVSACNRKTVVIASKAQQSQRLWDCFTSLRTLREGVPPTQ
jgi:hypothetical protein